MNISNMNMSHNCSCGKAHTAAIKAVITGKNAIERLSAALSELGTKKVFLLADVHTYEAAGARVTAALQSAGIPHTAYVFDEEALEPDEWAVGSAVMHYDATSDTVVSVGSGVLNDIGKILAGITGSSYVIVGTAPSMDGYASATSSMSRAGLKVSLNSKGADVIVGDTDVLKNAPLRMLKAGLGDMLAKYISICEWRIAHLITGEYYCEAVADLVRTALKKCVDNASGLLRRDEAAVEAVFEGLIIGGVAMSYAGLSRPASGVEHYFSHIWDMRGLSCGAAVDLHGIQCAIGTLYALRLYARIKEITPDRERALRHAAAFDFAKWSDALRGFLGKGAEAMIAPEGRDGKYDPVKHAARLDIILENWDAILGIMEEELPTVAEMEALFKLIDMPDSCDKIGIDKGTLPITFAATKDIRDKYVLSRLAWDLGIIDDLQAELAK